MSTSVKRTYRADIHLHRMPWQATRQVPWAPGFGLSFGIDSQSISNWLPDTMQPKLDYIRNFVPVVPMLFVCAGIGNVRAHGDATGIVLERHNLMTELRDANKVITGMARGKQPLDRRELATHAKAMAALARRMATRFPATDASRYGAGSNTRQNTWREFARFESLADELVTQADALADDADDASSERLKARVGSVGDTCKQCHKSYRRKKRH